MTITDVLNFITALARLLDVDAQELAAACLDTNANQEFYEAVAQIYQLLKTKEIKA